MNFDFESGINPKTKEKIHLYIAAMYLYSKGKSHPQIIKILSAYSLDTRLVKLATDKAINDEWDKLYAEARHLFATGKTHEQVVESLSIKKDDKDIADFVVNKWYKYKTLQMESIIESRTNIAEGSEGVVFIGLGVIVIFWIGLGAITKVIWGLAFLSALVQ